MPHPDLGTKLDVNGDEFKFCALHSAHARNRLEAFSGCEAGDNPDCHPEVTACPVFVQYLLDTMADFEEHRNYTAMIFPARRKNGEIVYEASPEHPDPTGLVDVRIYCQHYEDDQPVGDIEPMNSNQNADGSYRFECNRCVSKECNRCSWTTHCVCDDAPNCDTTPRPGKDWDEWGDEWDETEG